VTAIEIDTTKFLKDLLEEQRLESNDGAWLDISIWKHEHRG